MIMNEHFADICVMSYKFQEHMFKLPK